MRTRVNMAVVDDGCSRQFRHFISNSPGEHDPVVAQIGADADRPLGGKPTSGPLSGESRFATQGGGHSVREGSVDAGYGKEPSLPRALDAVREMFAADMLWLCQTKAISATA